MHLFLGEVSFVATVIVGKMVPRSCSPVRCCCELDSVSACVAPGNPGQVVKLRLDYFGCELK